MIDLIKKLIDKDTPYLNGVYMSRASMDQSIFAVIHIWSQLRSKDPNTKVGAAVYEPETGALHLGYNGFNHGVPDEKSVWDNRNAYTPGNKYARIVHAEANAIIKALRAKFNHNDAILYCTHWPCHRCVKDFIIPSGIKIIKYLQDYPPDQETLALLKHAEIRIELITL